MSKTPRLRLDRLIVDRGLAPTRARAQALILAGRVFVEDAVCTKAGTQIRTDVALRVLSDPNPYVSRGGMKLKAAIDAFNVSLRGKVVIDVGASTGGFTDCALQHGAERVYAIDVGYGQLDWKLRTDERVVVMERTNARHLSADAIPERADVIVSDVSFISLHKVMPAVLAHAKGDAELIVLVKPQFEATRDEVGKGGVVRKDSLRRAIIERSLARLEALGLVRLGCIDSPIHGPKGNVEGLAYLRRDPSDRPEGDS